MSITDAIGRFLRIRRWNANTGPPRASENDPHGSPMIERLTLGPETHIPRGQLEEAHRADQHTVAELLPAGFARYLRVFHPFLPADPTDPDEMP